MVCGEGFEGVDLGFEFKGLMPSDFRTLVRKIVKEFNEKSVVKDIPARALLNRFHFKQVTVPGTVYTIVFKKPDSRIRSRKQKSTMDPIEARTRAENSEVFAILEGAHAVNDIAYATGLCITELAKEGGEEVSKNFSTKEEVQRICDTMLGHCPTVKDVQITGYLPNVDLRPYPPVPPNFTLLMERMRLTADRTCGNCLLCGDLFDIDTLKLNGPSNWLYTMKCCTSADDPHDICHRCSMNILCSDNRCPYCRKDWQFDSADKLPFKGDEIYEKCLLARVTGVTWPEIPHNLKKFDTGKTALNIPGEHLEAFRVAILRVVPKFGDLELDIERISNLMPNSAASAGINPGLMGIGDRYTPTKRGNVVGTSLRLSRFVESLYFYSGLVKKGKLTFDEAMKKLYRENIVPYQLKLKLETVVKDDRQSCRIFAIPNQFKIFLDYWICKPFTNWMYNRMNCLIGHSWQKGGAEALLGRLLLKNFHLHFDEHVDDPYSKIDIERALRRDYDIVARQVLAQKWRVTPESIRWEEFEQAQREPTWPSIEKVIQAKLEELSLVWDRLVEGGDQERADMQVKAASIGFFYQVVRQTYANKDELWVQLLFSFLALYTTERPMTYCGPDRYKMFIGSLASGEWITSIVQTFDKMLHAFSYCMFVAERLEEMRILDPFTKGPASIVLKSDILNFRFQIFRFLNYADDIILTIEKFYTKYMSLCDSSRLDPGFLSMSDYFEPLTGFKVKKSSTFSSYEYLAETTDKGEVIGNPPNILKRYFVETENGIMAYKQTSDLLPKLLCPSKEVSFGLQLCRCLGYTIDAGGLNDHFYDLLYSHVKYIRDHEVFDVDPVRMARKFLAEAEASDSLLAEFSQTKSHIMEYILGKFRQAGMPPRFGWTLLEKLLDGKVQSTVYDVFAPKVTEVEFQMKPALSMNQLIASGEVKLGKYKFMEGQVERLKKLRPFLLRGEAMHNGKRIHSIRER